MSVSTIQDLKTSYFPVTGFFVVGGVVVVLLFYVYRLVRFNFRSPAHSYSLASTKPLAQNARMAIQLIFMPS